MSHDLSPAYWNNRYRDNTFSWDIGYVSAPLKAYFDQLKDKTLRILIPGAGNAYEAEYLWRQGFTNVYVCDFAQQPLDNLLLRCPGFNNAHLLLTDFFRINDLQFDLMIEQTFFCALHPSLRAAYFEKMHALLRPGGKLVGLLFNDALNTDKPPFGGTKAEYETYFQKLFNARTFDRCYNSIAPRAGRELFMILEKR